MNIVSHLILGHKIAEVISDKVYLQNSNDGLELLSNLYYQGFDKILIYETNVDPDFSDLKSGMAGEVLQKF